MNNPTRILNKKNGSVSKTFNTASKSTTTYTGKHTIVDSIKYYEDERFLIGEDGNHKPHSVMFKCEGYIVKANGDAGLGRGEHYVVVK